MAGLSVRAAQVLLVAAPMLALVGAAILFVLFLRKRDGELEVFELGVSYAGVVFVYSAYPLIVYLTGGLRFSRFADSRLFAAQPLPGEVATVAWYFFVYFIFFLAGYLVVRGRCKLEKMRFPRPDVRLLPVLVLLYAGVEAFFVFLKLYHEIRNPETYISSYLLYANLPLIVQQLANHLGGIELTLEVLLMVYLTLGYRKYKYIIFGWIILELLEIFLFGVGARTGLFIVLGSLLVTYHFAVKRLKLRSAVVAGLVILALFTLLGIFRDGSLGYADAPKNPFAYSSEFAGVFANSYDLLQRKAPEEKVAIFPLLYVADFLSLIPQQLAPVQKVDPAKWYVESYYPEYASAGGGLAFGAISEAIVGLGWIDATWRGAIIGVIFALVHRNFTRGRKSFWSYCSYLWLIVLSYQCFRGTTFILAPRFFYEFLTVLVVARLMLLLLPIQRKIGTRRQSQPRSGQSLLSSQFVQTR